MASGLDVAMIGGKSSLLTRQNEMAIIGNNIANANKTGYHRQTANVQSNTMVLGHFGFFGTGVHVETIVRNYDASLESSLRGAKSEFAYNDQYSKRLGDIEGIMAPQGENYLGNAMQDFAVALQGASSTPEDESERTALIGAANNIATQFNNQYNSLGLIKETIANGTTGEGTINEKVKELNTLVSLLPEMNDQIKSLEENAFRDYKANDMRDDRDEIISKISSLVNIHVTEETNARVTIRIGSSTGPVLLDGRDGQGANGTEYDTMEVVMNGDTPEIHWVAPSNIAVPNTTGADITAITSGAIKGLMDSREYLKTAMDDLDTYATAFATAINTQHVAGLDLDNAAGTAIFDSSPATGIISVLVSDPRKIALNGGAADELGDGTNGTAMWGTLNSTVVALSNHTILSHSDSMVGSVAEDVKLRYSQAETAQATETMFQNAVFEVGGVNMDEEMTEMLEVQRAYQASAKFLSVAGDMLTSVLQLI